MHTAGDEPFRTHGEDPDPIVATFKELLSAEEMGHIISQAEPKMRRAGACLPFVVHAGYLSQQCSARTTRLGNSSDPLRTLPAERSRARFQQV